jgi:hypothetical protein
MPAEPVSGTRLALAVSRVSELKKLHGDALGGLFSEGFVHAAEHAAVSELATKRSGLDFLALVVNILQRILVAISVQRTPSASLSLLRKRPGRA